MGDEDEEKVCRTCGVDLTGKEDHDHEEDEE